jgi:hypothetical protein
MSVHNFHRTAFAFEYSEALVSFPSHTFGPFYILQALIIIQEIILEVKDNNSLSTVYTQIKPIQFPIYIVSCKQFFNFYYTQVFMIIYFFRFCNHLLFAFGSRAQEIVKRVFTINMASIQTFFFLYPTFIY